MGSIRIVLSSLRASLGHIGLWLFAWGAVTVLAAAVVWPLWAGLNEAYDHHPGATIGLNQHLDADLARVRPELTVATALPAVIMLLFWTVLSGGILRCAGFGRRLRAADFFAECGRMLPRNLRAMGVGLVLALLLGWGIDSFDGWLRDQALADADPGASLPILGWHFRVFTLEAFLEAIRWVYGFLFLLLLFASKVARAFLCVANRRSAVLAWLRAGWTMLRHPLRSGLIVAMLALLWGGVAFLLGPAMAWADDGGRTLMLAGLGQILVIWLQVELVAGLLAARALAGLDAPPDEVNLDELLELDEPQPTGKDEPPPPFLLEATQ